MMSFIRTLFALCFYQTFCVGLPVEGAVLRESYSLMSSPNSTSQSSTRIPKNSSRATHNSLLITVDTTADVTFVTKVVAVTSFLNSLATPSTTDTSDQSDGEDVIPKWSESDLLQSILRIANHCFAVLTLRSVTASLSPSPSKL